MKAIMPVYTKTTLSLICHVYPKQRRVCEFCLRLLLCMLFQLLLAKSEVIFAQGSYERENISFTQQSLMTQDLYYGDTIALGDVNGDGAIDIISSNLFGQNAIYLNESDGEFRNRHYFDTTTRYNSDIALGDLNSDGNLDVVVSSTTQKDLTNTCRNVFYLNDGNGGFNDPTPFDYDYLANAKPLAENHIELNKCKNVEIQSMILGDIDGNGTVDIVTVSQGKKIIIYRNEGKNNFITEQTDIEVTSNSSIALGHLDDDGTLDVVVGDMQRNIIYWNAGKISPSNVYTIERQNQGIPAIALADLDDNGKLDIVIGDNISNTIYWNEGDQKFSAVPFNFAIKGNITRSIALGDMDGDGKLDIVVGGTSRNVIYWNDGERKFNINPYTFGPQNVLSKNVVLADLDGDSDIDIVTSRDRDQSTVYLNNRGLKLETKYLDRKPSQTSSIALSDLDQDKSLDIIAGNVTTPTTIYWNLENNNFTKTYIIGRVFYGSASRIATSDLNRDRKIDIVAASYIYDKPIIYSQTGYRFFLSQNLPPQHIKELEDLQKSRPPGLALGDLNGDGAIDLVTGFVNIPIKWYLPPYLRSKELPESSYFYAPDITLGDLDSDVDIDIVIGDYFGKSAIYWNDGAGNFDRPQLFGVGNSTAQTIALGDINDDGNIDIILGKGFGQNVIYMNNGQGNFNQLQPFGQGSNQTTGVALADMDGDGDIDIVEGNYNFQNAVYLNNGLGSFGQPYPFGLPGFTSDIALGDLDNNGSIDIVSGSNGSYNAFYLNRVQKNRSVTVQPEPILSSSSAISLTYTLVDNDAEPIGKVRICYSLVGGGHWRLAVKQGDIMPSTKEIVYPNHRCPYVPAWERGMITPTMTSSVPVTNTFAWDTFASGFFGQSDRVVVRIEVYPYLGPLPNSVPGPFVYPYYAATSLPFSVRGTQVQVVNERGTPVSGALVYQLPAGKSMNGMPISNGATAFHTNGQGYLQGRSTLSRHDQLLALAPQPLPITTTMSWAAGLTDTIHLYYTSGRPTETGVDALIRYSDVLTTSIISSGVQLLQVSPDHPLVLFDLRVALEWDASTDPNQVYLNQLRSDLHKAAEFLYDFTNGQATLGTITVTQNAEDWMFADVLIKATNRLRPLAVQGGVVYTATPDLDSSLGITYTPGQVIMGSTWNRYGTAGQNLGYDWPLALAHELSHYLFFLDDTYLGLNSKGLLTAVDSCVGSVMGDMYNPNGQNTEFIADTTAWEAGCSQTLAAKTLQQTKEMTRTEWATIQQRYPPLQSPMPPTMTNPGPSLMPFEFISITVLPPLTPTNTLPDPIIFLDYDGTDKVSSPAARAFLLRDEKILYDLGTAIGGQNRLLARGVRPEDTLCVFDPQEKYSGCTEISSTSERLTLRHELTWTPQIEIHTVNTATLNLQVKGITDTNGITLVARIFPALANATQPIRLVQEDGIYSATIPMTYLLNTGEVITLPIASGHVELSVLAGNGTVLTPTVGTLRTIVAFAIGGNFGDAPSLWAIGPYFRGGGPYFRGGGPYFRGGGPYFRGGGPYFRGGGPYYRGSNAPIASTDGQMIIFTKPEQLQSGDLYTVQSVNNYGELPPNTKPVGLVYSVISSNDALSGSVSFQYLGIDALSLGLTEADEMALTIYYSHTTNSDWMPLPTMLNKTYNLASAAIPQNHGNGLYALLATVRPPSFDASVSEISVVTLTTDMPIIMTGSKFDTEIKVLLKDCDGIGQIVTATLLSNTEIRVVLPPSLPAGVYDVIILKDGHTSPNQTKLSIRNGQVSSSPAASKPNDAQQTCP